MRKEVTHNDIVIQCQTIINDEFNIFFIIVILKITCIL